MFTKEDYMSKKCTFHEYYLQFDAPFVRQLLEPLMDKVRASTDEHLNDVPMFHWDRLADCLIPHICEVNKRINGRAVWSNSDGVCALKTIAREMI